MRAKLFLATALFLVATSALAQSPERFAGAKKLLAGIHEEIGHLETVYCGCPYVRKGRSGGDIDREACGLEARKNEKRSDRVEWEHVVPASWFGADRVCSGRLREGAKYYVKRFLLPCDAVPGHRYSPLRLMCSHPRGETWARNSAGVAMPAFSRARTASPSFSVFQ